MDTLTEGHTHRTVDMAIRIARRLGVRDEDLINIEKGALLHDIGKIAIPENILFKAGPLTEEERQIVERHSTYAYEMLSQIENLQPVLDIPCYHHERWDGSGYPMGLKGKEIPLAARIFAVVDVWDALCSNRPYRSAWPREKIIEHICSLAGVHFDPDVVEAFLLIEL